MLIVDVHFALGEPAASTGALATLAFPMIWNALFIAAFFSLCFRSVLRSVLSFSASIRRSACVVDLFDEDGRHRHSNASTGLDQKWLTDYAV